MSVDVSALLNLELEKASAESLRCKSCMMESLAATAVLSRTTEKACLQWLKRGELHGTGVVALVVPGALMLLCAWIW